MYKQLFTSIYLQISDNNELLRCVGCNIEVAFSNLCDWFPKNSKQRQILDSIRINNFNVVEDIKL